MTPRTRITISLDKRTLELIEEIRKSHPSIGALIPMSKLLRAAVEALHEKVTNGKEELLQ